MRINVHTSPALRSWGITILRVIVGVVFFVHGLQKALITGMTGVAEFMGQVGLPLPMASAVVVTSIEVVCGLALITGLLTRWAAIPLAITMLVATAVVHRPAGFFLPAGYEYALTLLAACTSLSLVGSGACALDNLLRLGAESAAPEAQRPTTKVA
jgi:putative oxidoreductase